MQHGRRTGIGSRFESPELADKLVSLIDAKRAELGRTNLAVDAVVADSEKLFGFSVSERTVRRAYQARRIQLRDRLNNSNPEHLAATAKVTADAAARLTKTSELAASRLVALTGVQPTGRTSEPERTPTPAELQERSRAVLWSILEQARVRASDVDTAPRDVASLLAEIGDVVVNLRLLVPDEE